MMSFFGMLRRVLALRLSINFKFILGWGLSMFRHDVLVVLLCGALGGLLSGCGSNDSSDATPAMPSEPTQTATPVSSPSPTPSPAPTFTPEPVSSPSPTPEPTPSPTPTPVFAADRGADLSYPLQYSADGNLLVMGNRNNALQVRSGVSNNLIQTMTAAHDWTYTLAFDASANRLASGGRDTVLRLWPGASSLLTTPTTIQAKSHVRALSFNVSRNEIASAHDDGNVYVWNLTSGQLIRTLAGHTGRVYSVLYTKDGKSIISAGADGKVKRWDAASGEFIDDLGSHHGAVYDLVLSVDGQSVFSAGGDGVVKQWSMATFMLVDTLTVSASGVDTTDPVALYALDVSADGRLLIAGDHNGVIHLWNLSAGRFVARTSTKTLSVQGSGRIHDLAFHPTNHQFSATSEDAIWRLWHESAADPLRAESVLVNYVPPDTTQQSARGLVSLAMTGMQPVFNTEFMLEQPETLEPYFKGGFTQADNVSCPQNGTMNYQLMETVPDDDKSFQQAGDQFAVTVNACADSTKTLNGSYALAMKSNNGSVAQIDAALTDLRITTEKEDSQLSGNLKFEKMEPNRSELDPKAVVKTESSDLNINLFTAGNIAVTQMESTLSEHEVSEVKELLYQSTLTKSGNDFGGYNIEVSEALILDPGSQYPSGGKFVIKALSGQHVGLESTATILDVDKVKIDTIRNGRTYTETVNWSDIAEPFTF